jgi:hypothetical protein
VIAEDREDAVAGSEIGERARQLRRVARIEVDEVARRDDYVGADPGDEVLRVAQLAFADEEADVDVRDLRDDIAVELLR